MRNAEAQRTRRGTEAFGDPYSIFIRLRFFVIQIQADSEIGAPIAGTEATGFRAWLR